jgi:beta-N-acetylhexosaminidase
MACGKHFPGHGDTATDSHLELPVVSARDRRPPRSRRARAVPPSAIAGRDPVADDRATSRCRRLTGEKACRSTLSARVLTDLLRGELGFDGIVTTDALDMGGVQKAFPPGEVAVRAPPGRRPTCC